MYEGTGPDQIHQVYGNLEVYTNTTTGTSYVITPDGAPDPFVPPTFVSTEGLHIEQTIPIEFDAETEQLLNMGKKTKRSAATANVTSPTKSAKTKTSVPSDDEPEYFDPNDTVRGDSNSAQDMSTDARDESLGSFFSQDPTNDSNNNGRP